MVRDAVDQMAASLKRIEQHLAESELGGGGGGGGLRTIDPASYVVKETDDLNGISEGGSVTLQPGETKTLVEARSQGGGGGLGLLAVGATDEPEVAYRLRVDDNRTVGGRTNSPLGLLNDPFSFVDALGGFIPASRYVEYEATLSSGASSSVDLAARLHVQMLGSGGQK